MAHYLVQACYTPASMKAFLDRPQDRSVSIAHFLEASGGKMHSFHYCLGDYDVVAIFELPDTVSAAALGLAIAGGGAVSKYRTTVLLDPDEGVRAMKKAQGFKYPRPQ